MSTTENNVKSNNTTTRKNVGKVNSATVVEESKNVNEFGQQTIKGSKSLDEGFFSSIIKSYENILYNPIATLALLLITLYYIHKITHPTTDDNIYGSMTRGVHAQLTASNSTHSALSKTIIFSLDFLSRYSNEISALLAAAFPYIAKPSNRNLWISGALAIVFLIYRTEYIFLLGLSHTYFIFTQLRNPTHKFIVVASGIFLFWLTGQFMDGVLNYSSLEEKLTKPVDVKPDPSVSGERLKGYSTKAAQQASVQAK